MKRIGRDNVCYVENVDGVTLTLGNKLIGDEAVGAGVEHPSGVVAHKWCSLDMKVSKHFVRAPAADEADDVGVHLGE